MVTLFVSLTASCLSILEARRIFGLYIVLVRNSCLTASTDHVFMVLIESFFFVCFNSAAISDMLGDWSGMDKEKAKNYILNCQVCFCFCYFSSFFKFLFCVKLTFIVCTVI